MTDYLYFAPTAVPEALSLMQEYAPGILPIAGGTDLVLDVSHRRRNKAHLLSLMNMEALSYVKDGEVLSIGPTTTLTEVSQSALLAHHCQALAEGAGVIGSVQIRNLATIAGNVCNALPCADTVPPLVASGAEIVIARAGQQRTMPITDFIRGPRQTALDPEELVLAIRFPKKPLPTGSAYLKHTYRKALDMTFISIAVSVTLDAAGERIAEAGVAPGNAGPTPIRAREAERILAGSSADDGALLEEFAEAVVQSSNVRDSAVRASARYRRAVLGVLAKRALKVAIQRARRRMEA